MTQGWFVTRWSLEIRFEPSLGSDGGLCRCTGIDREDTTETLFVLDDECSGGLVYFVLRRER